MKLRRFSIRLWVSVCFFVLLVLGLVHISWPAMYAYTQLVCATNWSVVEYWVNGTYVGSTSTPYEECSFVTSYYGGGGGGGGTPPGEEDPPPGGGGGGTPVVDYDKNDNGYVDCYQTAIFHTTSLTITSSCDEVRPNGSTHKALDLWISGIDGKAAYSVCNGTVNKVAVQTDPNTGAVTGWGYYVEIKDAGGNIWRFAHLKGTATNKSGVGLKQGDQVTAGTTQVGLCDNSGSSDGAHLHMEYWENGVKTCPTTKLGNCSSNA